MAVMKLVASARSQIALALIAAMDAGVGPATMAFYDGVMPAGLGAVTDQVLLGTATCSDPVATEVNGVITFGAVAQDDAADAGGQAAWVRLFDGDGFAVADFDVSDTAGNGAVKINTVTIVAGGPIRVNSAVITVSGA
jgi:hypothetical protein